ncbi:hypothetical protein [Paracidovorax avenae]|uniref:hypothetical protein n=1 Tax=Paracidovorax avenae TaxID=80867 RepID=UPI0012600CA0|nr:hypothetical protein [Paracidovorax avenae]
MRLKSYKALGMLFAAGLVVVLIVHLAFKGRGGAPETKEAQTIVVAPVPETTEQAPAPAAPSPGGSAAEKEEKRQSGWTVLLRQARDYRVLFHQMVGSPRDGNGLYALTILLRCASVRDEPAPPSWIPQSAEQQKAKILREERCASFIDQELSGDAMLALTRDPRIANDTYRRLGKEWASVSSDPQARMPVLERVLRTGDPLLMENLAGSLFHAPDGASIVFSGKAYTDAADQRVLAIAWVAATCGAVPGCDGPGDDYLVNACAARNLCVDSRQVLFALDAQERFGDRGAALYAEVYPQMVEAIRQRDAGVFASRVKAS